MARAAEYACAMSIALMAACGDSQAGTSLTESTLSESSTTSTTTISVTDADTTLTPTTGTSGGESGSTTTSTTSTSDPLNTTGDTTTGDATTTTTTTTGDTGDTTTSTATTDDDTTTGEPPAQCVPSLPPGEDCADEGPMQLAFINGALKAGALAVDATHVYFTTTGGFDDRLYRVPKCGGEVELLASAGQNPSDIELDDEFVYIVDYTLSGQIVRVPKAGGEPIPVMTGFTYPLRMISRGDDLLFGSGSETGIFAVPKTGGVATQSHDIGTDTAVYLVTDGEFVYWVHDDAFPGRVGRAPLAGGPAETVLELDNPGALAVTCEHVYVSDVFGRLQRAPIAGGGPLELLAPSAYRVVASDTHVYASDFEDKFVYRVPLAGGPPEVVAPAAGTPYEVVVDTHRVYWSDIDEPVIMSAPR
jgi:hypothetical protein